MKISKIEHVDAFLKAVDSCAGDVWLESIYGDKFNLKSKLSQYIALGELLGSHGEDLELYCSDREDHQYFFKFFADYPEVNKHID